MLINDLDDDALLYILDSISREDENGAFLVMAVCARWAALALQTASLWRYITLADYIEDWDVRLAISTTLARGKPLIVKALFPISSQRFSQLLEHQILHLSVYTVPPLISDPINVFSFLSNHLQSHRQDAIRRISWFGDKALPQPMLIPHVSSVLHMHVAQDLPDEFTRTVEQSPSVLLSHFTSVLDSHCGYVLMKCLSTMSHLVSLEISEDHLTWDGPEEPKIWTLPLLEDLYYERQLEIKPRLQLNVPRLSRLELTTHCSHIIPIFSNITGFTKLKLLSLELFNLNLPSTFTTAFPIEVTYINSVTLALFNTDGVIPDTLHSFIKNFRLMFCCVFVYKWNLSCSRDALSNLLGHLSSFNIPFDTIHLIEDTDFFGIYHSFTEKEKGTTTSEPSPQIICDKLIMGSDDTFKPNVFEYLPLAKKFVVIPTYISGQIYAPMEPPRFPPQFASQIQELDISNEIWLNHTGTPIETVARSQVFESLTRLSAPLDIVRDLFCRGDLPVLETLIILYPSSKFRNSEDKQLEAITLLYLGWRSGTVLSRLSTLGVDWWPRWDTIEKLLEAWYCLQTTERQFTLKVPGRPHPSVLKPLVDILNGLQALWPPSAIAGGPVENDPEECQSCLRSGFICASKTHTTPKLAPSQLFAITKNTCIGEYEVHEGV